MAKTNEFDRVIEKLNTDIAKLQETRDFLLTTRDAAATPNAPKKPRKPRQKRGMPAADGEALKF